MAFSLRPPPLQAANPAVLFISNNYFTGSFELIRAWHAAGFEVDYTNTYSEVTAARLSKYNVIIITELPYPNSPLLPGYLAAVNDFMSKGGGGRVDHLGPDNR